MILVCGEALIDFLPINHSSYSLAFNGHPGGSPLNTAVGIAKQRIPVGFFGALSNDFFGRMLYQYLTHAQVDTCFCLSCNYPTMLAFVHTEKNGITNYTFTGEQTADRMLFSDDLPAELPETIDCLAFGSFSLAISPCAEAYETLIKRESQHRLIVLDPNVRRHLIPDIANYKKRLENLLPYIAIVKASHDDLIELYGQDISIEAVARRWQQKGPTLIVITDGNNGAYTLYNDHWKHYPAKAVTVADTVGAGDAFQAALLGGLTLNGKLTRRQINQLSADNLSLIIERAILASALSCTHYGAYFPDLSELPPLSA